MTGMIIHPIGGHTRAFLRQVCMQEGIIRVTGDEELQLAGECHAAGYLDHADSMTFVITSNGRAYLERLARCE